MSPDSASLSRSTVELKLVPPQTEDIRLDTGLEGFGATTAGVAWLASILSAVPMAMYATDAEGRIVFFNRSAVSLFGDEPKLGSTDWAGVDRLRAPDGSAIPFGKSATQAALRERRAIRGAQGIVLRADGTESRVLVYATPLFDAGALIGGLNMIVELGEQDHSTYLEQRLAAVVECSEDAIISKDTNGIIATWNKAAEQLFGYTAEEAIGRSIMMLIPDDRQQEEGAILESIRNGRPVVRYETWRQRKDGTQVPIALTVSPLRDSTGRIIGASKIARDITDQQRLREHQSLLLNEMHHRVKNVLAVAGGLVGLSARSAESPKEMAKAVQERLGAYSRAHELTRAAVLDGAYKSAQQTTLHALLHSIMAPYIDVNGEDPNVRVLGEDLSIDANATSSLALVLHEFTTNAAKYGALSVPAGRVTVACREKETALELEWIERGGPKVAGPPVRQGFGSVLAVKTVEGQLGGSLQYNWQPEGLAILLTVPRDRLVQA